jgi:hypothetical protein
LIVVEREEKRERGCPRSVEYEYGDGGSVDGETGVERYGEQLEQVSTS